MPHPSAFEPTPSLDGATWAGSPENSVAAPVSPTKAERRQALRELIRLLDRVNPLPDQCAQIEALLARGANPDGALFGRRSLLHIQDLLLQKNNVEALAFLWPHLVPTMSASRAYTLLSNAVGWGCPEVSEFLVAQGVPVVNPDPKWMEVHNTLLGTAASGKTSKAPTLTTWVLSLGVPLSEPGKALPLHSAIAFSSKASLSCVDVLLRAGADPMQRWGPHEDTALHAAARSVWAPPEMWQRLLAAGGDLLARNADGQTPVDILTAELPSRIRRAARPGAAVLAWVQPLLCERILQDNLSQARARAARRL